MASGSATIDFDVSAIEARAWSRLRGAATTTLHPVENAASPKLLALSGTADLRVDGGRWSLRHSIETRRAGADLTGEVTGRLATGRDLRSTLGGRSRLRVADIGAATPLMQAAGVTLPADVVEGLAGSISATLDFAGTTDRPRAHIELGGRDLRARLLSHAGTLDAVLDVDANGVRARDVRASSGTTSLQASGQYLWRGPFEGRVELAQEDLSEIASQFRLPVAVSGSARLEGTIWGRVEPDKPRFRSRREASKSSKSLSAPWRRRGGWHS